MLKSWKFMSGHSRVRRMVDNFREHWKWNFRRLVDSVHGKLQAALPERYGLGDAFAGWCYCSWRGGLLYKRFII